MKKIILKKKYILLFLIFSLFVVIPFCYSKYTKKYNRHMIINAIQPTYTVIFNANGGTGTMENQTFTYKTSQALRENEFVKDNFTFDSWNTREDGTGISYDDKEVVSNLTDIDGVEITLYAQWTDLGKVARIGSVYYDSLQEAINAVSTDNTETNIVLLQNTNEAITINANQNIVFDLQNYTIGGAGTVSTIKNYGTIRISNGTITNSSVATSALVDNYSTGTIYITGGNFISLGTKQALYNEGGNAYISGNPYLTSKAKGTYDRVERATVQNRLSGSLTITGGTIVNNEGSGVSLNTGTVIIGTKDNVVDSTSLIIQAKTYGIYNYTSFKFYDGKISGITDSIYNKDNINDIENGYFVKNSTEVIDTKTYKVATLDDAYTVTFNANGGTPSETKKFVAYNQPVGTLPLPTRKDYIFDGWFTEIDGGEEVTANTIVSSNVEFYAHWHQEEIAEINGRKYYSLQSAVSSVTANNIEVTVTLLKNTSENITVSKNKNIAFDFQNYTLTNYSSSPVITNNGKIKITNGTIKQTKAYAAINNETTGETIITGGSIISTGERAGIYNLGRGIVTISGSAYISSNATGVYTLDSVVIDRGTIMNVNDTSVVNVTGGTIVATSKIAIVNNGILNLGVGDEIIDTSSPVVIGKTYGIKNNYTFNFYDGIIKGNTDAISGTITNQEIGSQIINGSEVIDGVTYKTIYLETT